MDAILYWNAVALEANAVSHSNGLGEEVGPTASARALAIVHLAMYDAFVGASGPAVGLDPYLTGLADPGPGTSPDAAIAAAAHATLSALFPSQRPFFDLVFAGTSLTGSGPDVANGHVFGQLVATTLLAARASDPGVSDIGYTPSLARGAHRVDPDNPNQGFYAPFYGANATCFAATERHALDAPPAVSTVSTSDYEQALRQVRGKGIAPELMGTVPTASRRNANETLIGLYWAYDGVIGLGTPPRLYNQILREVARQTINPAIGSVNTVKENARLFALVNAAMADAGILAWEQKYIHDLWRPVVGIREHDPSMGPLGIAGNVVDPHCDSGWLPLGAPRSNAQAPVRNFTPPFPAYPSGHATFGAAAFQIARLFYGVAAEVTTDTLFQGLTFVSDELNGVTTDSKQTVRPRHVREFADGLWQMIVENGLSRVYLGVHWEFDSFLLNGAGAIVLNRDGTGKLTNNTGGVPLGLAIAEDIFADGLHAASGAPPTV